MPTLADMELAQPRCLRTVMKGERVPQHAIHVRCYSPMGYIDDAWRCRGCGHVEAGCAVVLRLKGY